MVIGALVIPSTCIDNRVNDSIIYGTCNVIGI